MPANDITNMGDKLKTMEENEVVRSVSEISKTVVNLADRVSKQNPTIKKIILVERPARVDSLEKVNKISSLSLKEEIAKLGNERVILDCTTLNIKAIIRTRFLGLSLI